MRILDEENDELSSRQISDALVYFQWNQACIYQTSLAGELY
jgi:hypothetical protein